MYQPGILQNFCWGLNQRDRHPCPPIAPVTHRRQAELRGVRILVAEKTQTGHLEHLCLHGEVARGLPPFIPYNLAKGAKEVGA